MAEVVNYLESLQDFNMVVTMRLDEAFALFDTLPAVDIETIVGRWRGAGVHTSHPMDGILEAFGWYGKEFIDRDHVHPLLFQDNKGKLFMLDPRRLPFNLALHAAFLKNEWAHQTMLATRFALQTRKTRACVRMLEYRGQISASMIYDNLPIIDSFRLIDHDTLLGAMDFKDMPRPFIFRLQRER